MEDLPLNIICGKCNVYADYLVCGCTIARPIYVCQRNDDWDIHDVLAVFTRPSDAVTFVSPYGYTVYEFDLDCEITNE